MALRETANSLRTYFILAGVLGLGSALKTLQSPAAPAPDVMMALTAGVFAAGFLVAGIRLPRMLAGSTLFVKALLVANIAYQTLWGAFFLVAGAPPAMLAFPAIWATLSLYLMANVRRLATEARSTPPTQGAPAKGGPAAKSQLVRIGLLLLLLGPAVSVGLAERAAAADAAGTPHALWILTDVARATGLIGLGCMLVGRMRNRRWKRQAEQPA
jgi:hypothetical protein